MVDQPQQVLEEDSVEVHEDGTFLPPDTISGSLRQDPEGVPLEDEAVDEEHAPLLPHHHAHGRLGEGGVDGREGVVSEAREGVGTAEKGAASAGSGADRRLHRIGARWRRKHEERAIFCTRSEATVEFYFKRRVSCS